MIITHELCPPWQQSSTVNDVADSLETRSSGVSVLAKPYMPPADRAGRTKPHAFMGDCLP
ncbi:hypothetical protein PC129_g23592 [Phytophthora cactorum]|uniref:Uncharacterized protein n=1 Tax=Phytophthora cactorum TaxID=29920 RepID=A0A8T1AFP7_9STRA|nr:hypothetical protein PC112_g23758 [Phytophthora cactorum]KAG2881411.1 hypothetical protein PC117_g26394 [Phytophthora cactorum]KAG2887870.1 hypothetical protein PC114_g18638 [Phytophthora cactorum]KAG2961280.1 hypothetical protein PC119_g26148 [Phytophthora cactorum]KAG3002424.1 hypothetical protein PC120_g19740 [Phytophthora cactorum]